MFLSYLEGKSQELSTEDTRKYESILQQEVFSSI